MRRRKNFSVLTLLLITLFLVQCKKDAGNSSNNGGITVKGSLAAAARSVSGTRAVGDSNYVYAVNTGYAPGGRCRLFPVENGSFSCELSKTGSWVFVFIDSSKTGPEMIQGIFKAETLDSIAPLSDNAQSETDLGTLALDETTETATMDTTLYTGFIADLGYTETDAQFFGAIDDLMLRYVNPDIDGNGIIDMNDTAMPEYRFFISNLYTFDSVVLSNNLDTLKSGDNLPDALTIAYDSSSCNLNSSYTGDNQNSIDYFGTKTKYRMIIKDSSGTELFNSGSTLKTVFNNGSEYGYGIDSTDGYVPVSGKMPEGTYIYEFYTASDSTTITGTYTFTNVKTLADVDEVYNFVFPFPKFTVDSEDNIVSVEYTWKKYTSSGFVDATSRELELMMGNNPAEVMWHSAGLNANDYGAFVMINPEDQNYSITGTVSMINWSSLASKKRSDIVNVYVSTPTKIGIDVSLNIAK